MALPPLILPILSVYKTEVICIPKIYSSEDVLTAAMERINIAFTHFSHLYLCVSGGKDSSVMLQLCAHVARQRGRKFSIQYIDLEAQYQATIQHIEELRRMTADVVDRFTGAACLCHFVMRFPSYSLNGFAGTVMIRINGYGICLITIA